jgi:hypothetical protein
MEYRVETLAVDLPDQEALAEAIRANMVEWRAVRPGHKIATFAESKYSTQWVGTVDSIEIDELSGGRFSISVKWRMVASLAPGEDSAEATDGRLFTYTCLDHAGFAWVKRCVDGDECENRVEFEGSITFDETAYSCADHRNNSAFIDGVTWKIGESAFVPSLDED